MNESNDEDSMILLMYFGLCACVFPFFTVSWLLAMGYMPLKPQYRTVTTPSLASCLDFL